MFYKISDCFERYFSFFVLKQQYIGKNFVINCFFPDLLYK